ncbi:MAG: dihydrofolate reductase [Burkholderiaceae bacterium]|nr:dihydrofolate reductase [Burkholderiaceae bacterium]
MTRVTIASQFGDDFDQKLRAARPDVEVIPLPRVLTWPLPAKADVLLAIPVSAQVRAQPQPEGWPFGLRWVQLISVGLNNYPPWLLRGPLVTTAHGTSSQTIADFALACVLQHALRLPDRRVSSPEGWRHVSAPALAGSTLGLFGFGGIGRALAAKALALGLRVRALRASQAPLGMDGVEAARDLADLLATSDHLALVAPGTDATRHAINAASPAHARPGLHLINVSRGSLVDQADLVAALDSGRLAYASLDVTEPEPLPAGHPLYTHPRVYLSSHTCAISPQVRAAVLEKFLRSLAAWESGGTPDDPVDFGRGY